ncbi:MAG: SPOR domain-containing protein, partial [Thermodesulfovibrionia bacterium]|nr:SPOR domain-containing protein [Thermodesulfovibrionia bacterium]
QLPEDIQAEAEPGVPEKEVTAEEPAEKTTLVYDLDAETYGEKGEEAWAEVSPPEEVPAPEAPLGEGVEEFPKEPMPVDLPEDIWAQVEGKSGVPEEKITVEENAEDVKVQEPVKTLDREAEGKKDRELRVKTVKTPVSTSVFIKKGRSKKIWLYVPIMFLIFVLLGVNMPIMHDVYDDIKKRFLSSESVSTTGTAPSFPEDTLRNVSDEFTLLKEKKDTQDIKQYNETISNNQYANRLIYTIQTGSFINIERAQKQFKFIIQSLSGEELNYLRIEKVKDFYIVRFGKFEDYATAEKFLQALEPKLSKAIILNAYIKDDRIIKLYNESISSDW